MSEGSRLVAGLILIPTIELGGSALLAMVQDRVPPRVRLAAVAQAILLGLMAVVVLSRAGLVLP